MKAEGREGDNSFQADVVNVTSQEPHASQYGRTTDQRTDAGEATEQAAADFPIIEGRKRDAVGVFRPPEPQPSVGWWTRFCGCELLERERERMKDERTGSDRSLVRWVLKAPQRYRGKEGIPLIDGEKRAEAEGRDML